MPYRCEVRVVVVDTNIITYGPWRLASPEWRVLLYEAQAGVARVVVPEVVVREAVGKFSKEARSKVAEVESRWHALRSLVRDPPS